MASLCVCDHSLFAPVRSAGPFFWATSHDGRQPGADPTQTLWGSEGTHRNGVARHVSRLALSQCLGQLFPVVGLAVGHHNHQFGGPLPATPFGAEGFCAEEAKKVGNEAHR